MYLNDVVDKHDFTLIQEHWLNNTQSHIIGDNLKDINFACVSGMDDAAFVRGRPYGGCAIIWKNSLTCKIEPISCRNNRLCIVKVTIDDMCILICSLYMPCDTEYDQDNISIFNDVLIDLNTVAVSNDIDYIICGGDFNTDLSRINSLHTKSLLSFVREENLALLDESLLCNIDFTFESKSNQARSCIDHFLVSHNLFHCVNEIHCDHNVHNMSDHSVLSVSFDIHVDKVIPHVQCGQTPNWSIASEDNINRYKHDLDAALHKCDVPVDALYCSDHFCTEHNESLQIFHDELVNACLDAGKCIPHKKNCAKRISGWNQIVSPLKEQALFWHKLWKDNNCPHTGLLADIRRRTRANYHNVLKKVQRNQAQIKVENMARTFLSTGRRDFWAEIRKVRGNISGLPTSIDDTQGENNITDLFTAKYENLYNSVPYNEQHMAALRDETDRNISYHNNCKSHVIGVNDV